jgi:hypothetical protein
MSAILLVYAVYGTVLLHSILNILLLNDIILQNLITHKEYYVIYTI